MTRRADIAASLPCAPAGLRLAAAAAYVGVSVTHFLKAREKRLMPQPVDLLGAKVYRREELDEALAALPREGGVGVGVDIDRPPARRVLDGEGLRHAADAERQGEG